MLMVIFICTLPRRDGCETRTARIVIFEKTMRVESVKRAGNVRKVQRECLIVYLSNVVGWITCLLTWSDWFLRGRSDSIYSDEFVDQSWKSSGRRTTGRGTQGRIFWRSLNVIYIYYASFMFFYLKRCKESTSKTFLNNKISMTLYTNLSANLLINFDFVFFLIKNRTIA